MRSGHDRPESAVIFTGIRSRRLIGYDNERGKGDHKHFKGIELPYSFTSPDQLIADFLADIEGVTP